MELSVIIPTLNEEKYLQNTLECLRKQTFDDFELIIVDGNSKDKTREIAKEYTDRVFVLNERGVPRARNYGVSKARGKIVVHTDADCTMPPTWLERIHSDFKKNKVDMVWGPVYFSAGAMSPIARFTNELYWDVQKSTWKLIPYPYNPNLAFLRKAFDKIGGYRPGINFMDDYDIGFRASKKIKSYFDKNLVVFFSPRRFKDNRVFFDVALKCMRSLVEYHLSDKISEKFVPINEADKK